MSFKDYIGSKFLPYLLPIIPADAVLSPRSKLTPDKLGKIPGWRTEDGWVGFNWTKHYLEESQLLAWEKMYEGHTPIIGIQAKRFPGFDIDLSDRALVIAIRNIAYEEMGITIARGRENSARILMMYRAADGEGLLRKMRRVYVNAAGEKQAIEWLANGQQYLIEGMHPSGVPYEWEMGIDPLCEGADRLPVVAPVMVERVFARADAVMAEAGWMLYKGADLMNVTIGGPLYEIGPNHPDMCPDLDMLKDVLALLPVTHPEFDDYDDWARACIAIAVACGKDEAFYDDVFLPWFLGDTRNTEDQAREKWDSVRSASIGWAYLASIAASYGYTGYVESMFTALPDDPANPQPTEPAGPTGPLRRDFSDQFLAEQFAEQHAGQNLIFVPSKSGGLWMRCKNGIWVVDHTAGEEAAVVCSTASNFLRALPTPTPSQLAEAKSLDSLRTQNAVIGKAKASKAFVREYTQLDSLPLILAVPGGYIDPEGKLRDPDPSLLLTRTTGVRPDFAGKCPRFDSLVGSLANFDKDVEECLWGLIGYTLAGLGTQQRFPFLYGENGNEGKTTFFTILGKVFGSYGRTFDPKIFMKSRNDDKFAWGPFDGAFFIYGSEIAKGAEWNETGLKTATGGGMVQAEKKYLDSFEMWIRFMPWFSANNLPHFRGRDEALKRRMVLFQCMTRLAAIVSGFDTMVFELEGPAILAKGLRYRQLFLNGKREVWIAPLVQEWIDEYFAGGDYVGHFITDRLIPCPGGKVSKKDVYDAFRGYAAGDEGKEHILGRTEFYRQFDNHPKLLAMWAKVDKVRFGPRETNRQHAVTGVTLRSAFEVLVSG